MRSCRRILLGVVLVLSCGCDHNEYKIEMAPKGHEIQRKLTASRLDRESHDGKTTTNYKEFPKKELEAFAALYEKQVPSGSSDIHVFQGTFKGSLPSDVGGAGSYMRVDTSMGSASTYVETFRGSDDAAAHLDARAKAANRLSDLLIGWLDKELAGMKDLPTLRRFLDKEARQDLRNLGVYLWLISNAPRTNAPADGAGEAEQALAARAFQYLLVRNYLTEADLPILMRMFKGAGQKEQIAAALDRLLTRKVGITDQQTRQAMLAMVKNPEAAGKSLEACLRDTPEFKEKLNQWQAARKQDPSLEEPKAISVLEALAQEALRFELDPAADDRVEVTLALPGPPIQTNGKWDQDARAVAWKGQITPRDQPQQRLPLLCCAVWGQSDDKFQKEHFGKVVLAGWDLVQYCLWRGSLSPQESKEWDAFVANLKPGAKLDEQLQAFRFLAEPIPPATQPGQPPQRGPSYADAVTAIIRRSLEEGPKAPQMERRF